MNCEHVTKFYFGYYRCKKCGLIDEFVFGEHEETEEWRQFMDCEGKSQEAYYDSCLQANRSVCAIGPYADHVPYEVRSNYSFPNPKSSDQQLVYRHYRGTLPLQYGEEFDREFENVGKARCAQKRKMILAKHRISLRYGLPFCLEDEVKSLGGKVRVSEKDLG